LVRSLSVSTIEHGHARAKATLVAARHTRAPVASRRVGEHGGLRARARLIAALCLVVSVSYGALYYGFAVLITERAAGGEFSRGLLSAAYGGAVVSGGLAAVAVGRAGDRAGVRLVMALGALLAAGGLLAFASATHGWQVLAVWWLVLGPATAMTFYEPAYIAIQQAFPAADRARAIAALTLAAGFSGPVFTAGTGALVDALGWRDATRLLALALVACAPVAALLVRARPAPAPAHASPADPPAGAHAAAWGARLGALRARHVGLFTIGAIVAYGAIDATVVHRIARFEELGFGLGTVTLWAGISGLVTLPGRFLLPVLAERLRATDVFAIVLTVLAASTALMVSGDAYWQMALSFVLFGLVFGAALPLRAVVMGQWIATAVFGTVMGVQAALIAGGRAGVTAAAGGAHDVLDGYGVVMAILTALLVAGAVMIAASGRRPGRQLESTSA
jgi:MFS family permease